MTEGAAMKAVVSGSRTTLSATLITSLLAGCASGGDSGNSDLGNVIACVASAGLACPRQAPSGASNTGPIGSPGPSPNFTSWAALPRNQTIYALALVDKELYSIPPSGRTYPYGASDYVWPVEYDAQRKVTQFEGWWTFSSGAHLNLAAIGQPGIEIRTEPIYAGKPQSAFTSIPAASVAAIANPYDLGWNYQSFGVWNQTFDNRQGEVVISSLGSRTAGSAIPTTGTATFNGKLAGFYISPTGVGSVASAALKVDADFGARSLNFASTGTMTTRNFSTGTAAPGLNLSGTLTYSSGTNSFSGTLSSANGMSGTSTGRFYGPAAQELGGVFSVRSSSTVESLAGAYGAKR
jgi:hypothetical protein